MLDSKGVIRKDRGNLDQYKSQFATEKDLHTLDEALVDADVFVGLSKGNILTAEMVQTMAKDPIVFAMANPTPEIDYHVAMEARPDIIMATGRSDFPNQVNNVLGFPFIFRGALDVRATGVSEKMKVAAAHALAELAREPVSEVVLKAYNLDHLAFGPDYIIPKPFDPRVLWYVAPAVAAAACEEGLAQVPCEDFDRYKEELHAKFQATYGLMHTITVKAKERAMRVVYPQRGDPRIIRAARRVSDEGI